MAASAPPGQSPPPPPPSPRPKGRVRSGRLVILAVLVVVAVVLPAGAALLDRRQPATRLEPRTPPASASTAVQTYPPGTPAPALRLPGLDGGQVDLAALRGRPVVVNFWATWCDPCVREFPLLRQAAAAHRPDRLAVVGVLTNDRPGRRPRLRPPPRRHLAGRPRPQHHHRHRLGRRRPPPHLVHPPRRHPRLPPARRAHPGQPRPPAGRDPLAPDQEPMPTLPRPAACIEPPRQLEVAGSPRPADPADGSAASARPGGFAPGGCRVIMR